MILLWLAVSPVWTSGQKRPPVSVLHGQNNHPASKRMPKLPAGQVSGRIRPSLSRSRLSHRDALFHNATKDWRSCWNRDCEAAPDGGPVSYTHLEIRRMQQTGIMTCLFDDAGNITGVRYHATTLPARKTDTDKNMNPGFLSGPAVRLATFN